MKIIVLGAGVIGVRTAWYLKQSGHEVTVIDRASGPAMETSFANAGQLSYGYTTPWAAPGIPFKAAKWMMKPHSPLIFRPDGTMYQLKWMMQMLKNCETQHYTLNKERMVRVSEYSREMFARLEQETGLNFEGRHRGTLQIFRTEKEVAASMKDREVLAEYSVPFQALTAQECLQYEPALGHAVHKLAGALHLPNDSTGDCYLFTNRLADLCKQKGVEFLYDHTIERFDSVGNYICAVYANGQRFEADHFVCALGSFSRSAVLELGLDVPIYPVKGYSLTIPITDSNAAPVSTVLDETYKVALTRFDNRIRVGGMAELSGYELKLNQKSRETLELVVNELLPGSGDLSKASLWTGLRPMTPDSTPIIGKSVYENLTLNTGHGTLGWTMSLGSGKITADIVSGVTPEIKVDDLALSRYSH